jgi:hypothetical protein
MNTTLPGRVKVGVLILAVALSASTAMGREFFVSIDGGDEAAGTKDAPFATIARARDAIRKLSKPSGAAVRIGPGRYFISKPLTLTPADSGTKDSPVTYAATKGQNVVISGGRKIKRWRKESGDIWVADLPDVKAGKWYFRQLFAGDRRLARARTPNAGHLTTAGSLSKFAAPAKKHYGGYSGASRLRRQQPDAFCGFSFRDGDIKQWPDYRNAEIITFHSWECSWQTIRKIDLAKRDVHFNTPCRYPIGFFSLKCRYRIENIAAALDSPGEWTLDKASGKLRYFARKGEDPNKMDMLAPACEQLVVIAGDAKAKRRVQYIKFRGLSFQHARYPMGVYDVAKNWPDKALKIYPDWPKKFAPGYTDSQAAPLAGQAIELTDANHITFENCRIAHCGAYAIKIGRRCSRNRIAYCRMEDLGGGGVLIGMDVRTVAGRAPSSDAPSHNEVSDSVIKGCSLVHPSAVGVWVAQARYTRIAHNEIADVGYAGVHLGWTWGRAPNYSDHNTIEANDIHHVMRDLADAGGLYSLGILDRGVYRANYIHDIKRAEGAVGAPTDGIFLDQGSKGLLIEHNVIRNAGTSVVRFNKCRREDHTWKDNDFGPGHWGTSEKFDAKKTISQAGPRKPAAAKP